jgi:prepilin-type processing-associated H-X9-DG protein
LNRLGTFHRKGKMLNVVFADGHVALIDPRRDLFANGTQVFSAKYYLWGEPKVSGTDAAVPGWPNAANARTDPPGRGYWKRAAPGL